MGRPLGAPNRNKRGLLARLQRDFPNYDPIVEMARIANDMDNDVPTRLQANKEVAQYVAPKLKSVEIKADVKTSLDQQWKIEFVNPTAEAIANEAIKDIVTIEHDDDS